MLIQLWDQRLDSAGTIANCDLRSSWAQTKSHRWWFEVWASEWKMSKRGYLRFNSDMARVLFSRNISNISWVARTEKLQGERRWKMVGLMIYIPRWTRLVKDSCSNIYQQMSTAVNPLCKIADLNSRDPHSTVHPQPDHHLVAYHSYPHSCWPIISTRGPRCPFHHPRLTKPHSAWSRAGASPAPSQGRYLIPPR